MAEQKFKVGDRVRLTKGAIASFSSKYPTQGIVIDSDPKNFEVEDSDGDIRLWCEDEIELDPDAARANAGTDAKRLCDFVAREFGFSDRIPAHRCGLLAFLLYEMLRAHGYSPKAVNGTVQGVGHVWLVCDGEVCDPTAGQFRQPIEYPSGTEFDIHALHATGPDSAKAELRRRERLELAGMAMQGLLSNTSDWGNNGEDLARQSVWFADAILAHLDATDKGGRADG